MAEPEITPVPSGVTITSTEEAHQVNSFATIYVALVTDQSALNEHWKYALDQIELLADNEKMLGDEHGDEQEKAALLNRLTNIRARFGSARNRRALGILGDGILEDLGSIGANVFGLATAHDVQQLAKANEVLADAIDGVATTQKKTIAVVNKLGHAQVRLQRKVNEVIGTLGTLSEGLANVTVAVRVFLRQQQRNQALLVLSMLVDNIETQMAQYQADLDQADLGRISCESHIVNDKLVTRDIIQELLSSPGNRVLIEPLAYYQYIKVEKMTTINGTVYCILKAPQMSSEPQKLYHLNTFQVCNPSGCYKVYHDVELVFGTLTEDIYFPVQCFGRHPVACQPGVVYPKNQQKCLHGLITGDPRQQEYCSITYKKAPEPAHPVSTNILNRYVLRTDPVLYHYRCEGRRSLTRKLEAGTYIINVEPGCIMDAGHWTLLGLPERTFFINITFPAPEPVDLSHFNFSARSKWTPLDIPPGIKQLEFDTYKDLVAPKQPHVREQINEIQKDIGKHNYTWIWIAIGVVGAIALCLVLWKFFTIKQIRNSLFAKKAEKIIPSALNFANPSAPNIPNQPTAYYSPDQEKVKIYPTLPIESAHSAPSLWSVHVQTDSQTLLNNEFPPASAATRATHEA